MAGEPPAQKKRRLPFKPPSRAPSAGPSTSAPKPKSKNTKTNKTSTKASTAASSSKASAQTKSKATTTTKRPRAHRERSISQEPDYILAEIVTNSPSEDVASSDPTIPPKLLTRLLHQQFTNEKTKVAKDANAVVAKYVDVFVREAIARAAYERAETDNRGGKGASDGFLEVNPILFPRSFLLTDGVSGN
ncbi:hypothetical protein N7450_006345 [Penicillium hetheringtonii]|uniref:CENP-S associating centromere protein X-domain-containing protein n=1 Tax=Penicillium hetheringtonii TaxID=911720 RepID=A0AAD6DKI7_9EURO|nr:hypothetical protein N7450_006345 [Penicillium hetheringtonii]